MTILPLLLMLQVVAPTPYPDIVTRSHVDKTRGVDFHAIVTPDTVYVGQQASYQLGVFLDQDTRQRLRRNPEFIPPESQSMLSYDLPDRAGGFIATIDGQPFEVHVFRRALFPLTAGRYQIPSARLTYSMPQSSNFFSREESFSLKSEPVTLIAIDPPAAGRPPGWAGAVGTWRATARLDSAARDGDPLVLTLRIEGTGNVTLLPRPPLAIPWATVVAADERVALDSTPAILGGSKEFDWLITPAVAGAQQIPAIHFSFFDPRTRRYEETVTQPFTVRIAPDAVTAAQEPRAAPPPRTPLSLRTALGDEVPPPLGDRTTIRWLLLAAPLAAIGAWLVRRPRRPPKAVTPADRLDALARGRGDVTPAEVRRAFLDALRARTGLDPAALTGRGAWLRALRLEGVGDDTAQETEAFVAVLDAAVFGGADVTAAVLAARGSALVKQIGAEAVARASRRLARAAAPAILLLGFMTGAALFAGDVERAQEAFAQGIAAYTGADYLRAERLFEDAAREAPRAAAAWANAGTAAWASHDTAQAVVGWQHALRLDPTAPELRERLGRVRAPQDVGDARVLALPARLPSAIAIAVWLVGWVLVARQIWRRRPAIPLLCCTLLGGGATGLAARRFEDALEGRNLSVVVDPTALRTLPALGAESRAVPLPGEVARVVARRGVWSRIELGDRAGWIPTERLAPLGHD